MGFKFYRYVRYHSADEIKIWTPNLEDALLIKSATASNLTKLQGGTSTGADLEIYGNQTDTYPKIKLNGNGHMNLYVDSASGGKKVYIYDLTTVSHTFSHVANASYIFGGAVTGDDLYIKANTTDTKPYISMNGNSHLYLFAETNLYLDHGTGSLCIFREAGTLYGTMYEASGDWQFNSNDSNRNIYLNPHGTGLVKFGTYNAITTETNQGYITILDSGGTARKLCVVA